MPSSRSDSPRARPRSRTALLPPAAASDDDQSSWLVTFSDLVLQLFAFVIVWVVLTVPRHATSAAPALSLAAGAPEAGAVALATALPPVVAEPLGGVVATTPLATEGLPAPAPPREPALPGAGEPEVPPSPAERSASAARLAAVGRYLEAMIAAHDLGGAASVIASESDLVLAFSDTIGFAPGSAAILPGARPILEEVRTLAGAMPDFGLDVAGHTDDVPIHTAAFPSNLELSLARAASVANALSAGDADLQRRTVAAGFAEHRPAASNHDGRGRAQNRRVEIRFVPIDYSTPPE